MGVEALAHPAALHPLLPQPIPSLAANPTALWRSMQLQMHHGPGAKGGGGGGAHGGAFKRPREEAAPEPHAAAELAAQ